MGESTAESDRNNLGAAGLRALNQAWAIALEMDMAPIEGDRLVADIDTVFAGGEVGYKKALIIQAAGKTANIGLDAFALQKGDGAAGSWDAREFAKRSFVPWNSSIGSPLGVAADPYVSNQFRAPRFDTSLRAQRRDKVSFDATIGVLEVLNSAVEPTDAEAVLVQILLGLRRFLEGKSVLYPIPQRSSLSSCLECIAGFLATSSGGTRLQALTFSLFECLEWAGLRYADIRSGHVNASDTATGGAGDIMIDHDGTRIAIEAKDRPLNYAEVEASAEKARLAQVTELVFVVNRPLSSLAATSSDLALIETLLIRQFSSGLNIYLEPFESIASSTLMLVGEAGRRRFLESVGIALEMQRADRQHRWAWAEAVRQI